LKFDQALVNPRRRFTPTVCSLAWPTVVAISIGNYWQGIVAERMGYAAVLYLNALFAVLVILVIPLLRERE